MTRGWVAAGGSEGDAESIGGAQGVTEDDRSGAGGGTSNKEDGSKEDAGSEDTGAGVEAGNNGRGMGVEAGIEGRGAGADAGIDRDCVDTGKEGCGAGILRDKQGRGDGDKPEMTGCTDDTNGDTSVGSTAGSKLTSAGTGAWPSAATGGRGFVTTAGT